MGRENECKQHAGPVNAGRNGREAYNPPDFRQHLPRDYKTYKELNMTLHLELEPLLALVAGIVILVVPRLLNYVVAGYLILIGLAGLLNL